MLAMETSQEEYEAGIPGVPLQDYPAYPLTRFPAPHYHLALVLGDTLHVLLLMLTCPQTKARAFAFQLPLGTMHLKFNCTHIIM